MNQGDPRLGRLAQVVAELAAASDQDALLLRTVRAARELVGATYSSIALVEGEWLHWLSAAGKPIEEVRGYKQPVSEGLCGWVVRNGRGRRSDDVLQEPDYFLQYAEMRSEVDVPIRRGELVIGVLNAESPAVKAFTVEDEAVLQTLAAFVALAL